MTWKREDGSSWMELKSSRRSACMAVVKSETRQSLAAAEGAGSRGELTCQALALAELLGQRGDFVVREVQACQGRQPRHLRRGSVGTLTWMRTSGERERGGNKKGG